MNDEDVTSEWLSELLGGEIGSIRHERIGDGLVGMNLRVVLDDHAPGASRLGGHQAARRPIRRAG